MIKIYTIGYAGKNAKTFFFELRHAGIITLMDIRLNNTSQLAGFTKRDDLSFFLKELCSCSYKHMPNFAPTKDLLDAYKKKKIDWNEYARCFIKTIQERKIENEISIHQLDNACLLCSESTPERCHRRLVSEYLIEKFINVEVKHL